jgi:predicted metal-binding protein
LILKRIVTHLPVLEKIVEHCIAVEPECRYQSVDEVAETILNLSTTRMQSALLLSYFLTYFPQSYTMAV